MYKIEKKTEYIFAVSPPPASGDELTEEICACMIEQAITALKNSFAPYSHYNVAAAALFASVRVRNTRQDSGEARSVSRSRRARDSATSMKAKSTSAIVRRLLPIAP